MARLMEHTSRPELKTPPGACDTHVHVVADKRKHPFVATAVANPNEASVADLLAMHARLGIDRCVVVQPSVYGTDNTVTMMAVAEMGERARAIVAIGQDVGEAEIARMDEGGARGARFHMLPGGAVPWEDLEPVAARIAPFGWHIQLQLDGRTLPHYLPRLRRLPCRLVIDHTGKFLEPVNVSHPGFQALLELLDTGRCWVKLSAPYETSKVGPPTYADVGVMAAALARHAPERMLWDSNWPHFSEPEDDKPDDAMLLDVLLHWVADAATRAKALADNPADVYGWKR